MSAPAVHHQYTYGEYLSLEDSSAIKHEYYRGDIYAMAGGTPDHAALAACVIGILSRGLPLGCRTYTSDLRVRVVATGLSTYPDAAVVCGTTIRATDDVNAITNPVLLVEVTSPSTVAYDTGEKLQQYQAIPSVRDILIVSHTKPELTLHRRTLDQAWQTRTAETGSELAIDSLGLSIRVDDLYRVGLEDMHRDDATR